MGKASKIAKGKQVARQVKAPVQKSIHKVHHKLRFYRPKTRRTRSVTKQLWHIGSEIRRKEKQHLDNTKILINPISSDKNIHKMEKQNTLTFLVHTDSTKCQIKTAFAKLYGAKVRQVNTLRTPEGQKKAFIRLANDKEALGIASKIGLL